MPTSKPPSQAQQNTNFSIVGIGASAGGLNALKTFFAQVPEDSGLAFVVVVHLSPDHESHLADLLQPHVKMPVQQVTETIEINPNQVYVIPPGRNISTVDTHLRLTKMEKKRRNRAPIDHFFRTLATTHDGSSVGVILTGTGSDGTLGIKEIKEQNGLTIAQDPTEAEYDGMPQSAIATGLIDLILPLEKIPNAILHFARTEPKVTISEEEGEVNKDERSLLQKVIALVRTRTGHDFSRYKRATLLRRITRRMQLRQFEELSDYLNLLQQHPEEAQALSGDMLITVTNFFRDTEVFEHLKENIIPALFEGKNAEDTIRIWSVGCATGEEAYSLTMLLLEEATRREHPPGIQVFASDLHDHSLERAREGFYPGDIKTDVSEERLKRFFVKEDSGYRIRKEIRELIIFAPHNLLGDPPFSRMDLISCRNVLIYLQREVQQEVMELFHYALAGEGFLLLGTAETVEGSDLFRTQQKKICLYRKRNIQAAEPRIPVFPLTQTRRPDTLQLPEEESEPVVYGTLHYQMVEQYAPPSMLVSPDDQVVHFSERVGRFLVHPGGELTSNIFRLVRQELHIELRSLLYTARENEERLSSKPIPVQFNGHPVPVVLHANPSQNPKQKGFVLLIFEERPASSEEAAPTGVILTEVSSTETPVLQIENELYRTRQRLQAIIEEYEAGQEEMRASNEEMQSTNEEMRSALEELETSKEELQSMNEELQTMNQENRHKVEELSQLSSDLQSVLQATDIATLFLDKELRILRFTPRVGELFNVRTTDRGRPISDITHQLGYNNLEADARKVLAKLIPVEREIQDEKHRWYLTRVLPYRSTEDRIEGVVITFVEITSRKKMEEELRTAKTYAEIIIDTLHEPLLVLTPDLQVRSANQAFFQHFRVKQEETKDRLIYELGNGQWDIPALRKLMYEVLPKNQTFTNYEMEHEFENIGKRIMLLNGCRLDHVQLILLGIRDVTQEKLALRAKEDFLAHMSHEIRTPLNAIVGLSSLLLTHSHPEQEENLQTLKFSAENLKMLVNDILDFSKIQAGKVIVEKTAVNLAQLLRSLQKAHELRAQEQANTLQFQTDEQIPEVILTDQLKLSQILNNLIGNALKFTQHGAVAVAISLESQEKDQLWITFSVQDSGVGIPANKIGTIFDAFTQADISTVREYGGTGLGLSITKLLLELMGSQIHVESKEGKGSRFYFTLAVKPGSSEDLEEPTTLVQPEDVSSLANLRILVVEDAAINRMVLIQFLNEWWNISPDEAENGQHAIDMASAHSYNLILMDVRMPVMNGYQATKAIRQLPGYAKVPILALTADTINELAKHTEATLFDDVITKPFDPQELQQKVLRHVQRDKATSQQKPAENTTTQAPSTIVDLGKVKEIFEDKKQVHRFLENALQDLEQLQSQYTQALANQDASDVGNIVHKSKVLLDTLNLNELQNLLEQGRDLVKESADKDRLKENQTQAETRLEEVRQYLLQQLEE